MQFLDKFVFNDQLCRSVRVRYGLIQAILEIQPNIQIGVFDIETKNTNNHCFESPFLVCQNLDYIET